MIADTSVGFPTISLDFNGPGENTESSSSGVLSPGVNSWQAISPGVGVTNNVNFIASGLAFDTPVDVNVRRAGGSFNLFHDLFDG